MLTGEEIKASVHLSDNSEFLSFYEEVEKDPHDQDAWNRVLGYLDEESIDVCRLVYKDFLKMYPLFITYWQKWIDREIREGNVKTNETKEILINLYEEALRDGSYCVELWISYLKFASVYLPKDQARQLFKRAQPFIGSNNKAHMFWDVYISFEVSINSPINVSLVYKSLLETPFLNTYKYWEPYVHYSEKQPTERLGDQQEIDAIKEQYDKDEQHKYDSDIQRLSNIKQTLLNKRKDSYSNSVNKFKLYETYETSIKRFTFSLKNPSSSDIKLWNEYLDTIEKKDTNEAVIVLYERALIPLLYNSYIWTRYILWSYNHMDTDKAITLCSRAIRFIPEDPSFHILLLQYLEEKGQIEEHNKQLEEMHIQFPSFFEGYIYHTEYLIRQHKTQEAIDYLTEYSNHKDISVNEQSYICVYLTNYYTHEKKVDEARSVYSKYANDLTCSSLFWKSYLQFEYYNSSSPSETLSSILSSILLAPLSYYEKLMLYERYMEYCTFCEPISKINSIRSAYYSFKQQYKPQEDDNYTLKAGIKRSIPISETETTKQTKIENQENKSSSISNTTMSQSIPSVATTPSYIPLPAAMTTPSVPPSVTNNVPTAGIPTAGVPTPATMTPMMNPYMNPYYYQYYYQQYPAYQYPPKPQ